MIGFETKIYIAALDGEMEDLNMTIFAKAEDIEAMRRKLPELAAMPLKLYGSQLVFVTTESKPMPVDMMVDIFQPNFWKGKKK